ncbi:MAG: energy transducer TonB, partial [Rhodospirillales bacterium]|nr:energy transducer TonB [Rhodospirillales bacterium]
MRKAATISAAMHVAVFLIAWFGLPNLFRTPPAEDSPLIVEILPIAERTNAPPPKPEPPKPEPPKPEPPK